MINPWNSLKYNAKQDEFICRRLDNDIEQPESDFNHDILASPRYESNRIWTNKNNQCKYICLEIKQFLTHIKWICYVFIQFRKYTPKQSPSKEEVYLRLSQLSEQHQQLLDWLSNLPDRVVEDVVHQFLNKLELHLLEVLTFLNTIWTFDWWKL